jgi:hypothetical protein
MRIVQAALLIPLMLIGTAPSWAAGTWAQHLGAGGVDVLGALAPTADGGMLMAGYTDSSGAGMADGWVVRLDVAGRVRWSTVIGGSANDSFYSVQPTADGGAICAGDTLSVDSDGDGWIAMLDRDGEVVWQKLYGGDRSDSLRSIQRTGDGGYVVAGYTQSYGMAGSVDAWVLKLDQDGAIQWQRTYGGSNYDDAFAITLAPSGGYAVCGEGNSFGDVDGEVWCLRLEGDGELVWQKAIGGASADLADDLVAVSGGGYVIAAETFSFGAGNFDLWALKLDDSGELVWQQAIGGAQEEDIGTVAATAGQGVVLTSGTTSFGAGQSDAWLLRLDGAGGLVWQRTYGGAGRESGYAVAALDDGRIVTAGFTDTYGAGGDTLTLRLDADGGVDDGDCTLPAAPNPTVTNTSAVATTTNATVASSNAAATDSNFASTTSNAGLGTLCASADLPDLTGAWVALARDGETIAATFSVQNRGAKRSPKSVVRFYSSKKAKLNNKSRLIATEQLGQLASGRALELELAATRGKKHKYLLAVLDPDGELDEELESNNTVVIALP